MAGAGRLTSLASSILGRVRPVMPAPPILVALSGGADSAVAGWAARRIAGEAVRGVFVDHGLAGSAGMARAARAVAGALALPLTEVSVTVPGGASPEGRARRARLEALERECGAAETIVTGHTADDLAETVLANFLRGAGSAGLSGIPPRRGRWARPLLEVTRAETRELATLLGLPWRDDPANADPAMRRNLLRRRVIPELERTVNPGLRSVLARSAAVAAADEDLLAAWAERVPVRRDDGAVRMPAPLLATLPAPVAARAVRAALREAAGPYPGRAGDVADVLAVAAGGRARAGLPGGLVAEREGVWLTIHRGKTDPPAPVPFPLPGTAVYGEWRLEGWVEERAPSPWPAGRWTVVLDADRVAGPATVRPPRPGDRLELRGGSKPVAEALAEAGVPARLREAWPVLEADGRLLWVAGGRTGASAWISGATSRYLWVLAHREKTWR